MQILCDLINGSFKYKREILLISYSVCVMSVCSVLRSSKRAEEEKLDCDATENSSDAIFIWVCAYCVMTLAYHPLCHPRQAKPLQFMKVISIGERKGLKLSVFLWMEKKATIHYCIQKRS